MWYRLPWHCKTDKTVHNSSTHRFWATRCDKTKLTSFRSLTDLQRIALWCTRNRATVHVGTKHVVRALSSRVGGHTGHTLLSSNQNNQMTTETYWNISESNLFDQNLFHWTHWLTHSVLLTMLTWTSQNRQIPSGWSSPGSTSWYPRWCPSCFRIAERSRSRCSPHRSHPLRDPRHWDNGRTMVTDGDSGDGMEGKKTKHQTEMWQL